MDKILLALAGYLGLKYFAGVDLLSYFTSATVPATGGTTPSTNSTSTTTTTTTNGGQTQPTGGESPGTTLATQANNPQSQIDQRGRLIAGMNSVIAQLQGEGYTTFDFNVDQWNELMRMYSGVGGTYPSPEQLMMNDRGQAIDMNTYLMLITSWFEGGYGGGGMNGMGNIGVWSYGQGAAVPMERLRIVERGRVR